MMERSEAVESRLNAKVFNLFALHKATQVLTSTLNFQLLTETAVDVMIEMGHSKHGALYLMGDAGEALRLAAAKSIEDVAFPPEFGRDTPLVQAAADRMSQPFLWMLCRMDEEALIVPLGSQNILVGFFVLQGCLKPESWSSDDLEILETLAVHVGLCVQNARLYQRIIEQKAGLAAMTQQLWQAAKLATMGELAASIAHELNNPLATVSLRVESLLSQVSSDGPQYRALEIIEQEVERMGTLVANLLQFSRRSQQQISTVDMRLELAGTLELIQYHLRNHGITVVQEFAPDVPMVHADRQQFRQLFLNLFTNASDAMLQGGTLTIRVWATNDHPSTQVVIEIADTGVGIAPEDLLKVMEPFFTTKAEGKGTGLGLPICRRIVQEHGGTLDLASELGKGTTVRIALPLVAGAHTLVESDMMSASVDGT